MQVQAPQQRAFQEAIWMLESYPDLEIRSALKQAAWDNGIEEGEPTGEFVKWAEERMGL